MKNPLLLSLFLIGIGLFIVFYAVSTMLYRQRHQTKYHFYQMFPYEFNFPSVFKQNIYGNLLFVLSIASVVVFYNLNPIKSTYSVIGVIISIVLAMLTVLLILLPLRYLRTHMVVSTFTMILAATLPLFNLFLALDQYKIATQVPNQALAIISMVISGLLGLSMLLLVLNPKLTFKIYLEKHLDENGKEVFQRPKLIYIALNEWWAIFIFVLSPLAVLLLNII